MRELDPARDRYLILATDGLWERLTNEEAAKVVCSFKEQPSRHHQVRLGPRRHYYPTFSILHQQQ
jgi:serine/threonine protein phosphatase PrpC